VVDLSHLDPSKPAVVDPRAARGQKKFQVSEKTLTNDSYVKGFDAIRAGDYALAVQHFKKARIELGNDLLVRNGLALAEDLVKMQARKAQTDAARLEYLDGALYAIHGNYDAAIRHLRTAVELQPANALYRDELSFVQGISTGVKIATERETDLRRKAIAEKAFQVAEKSLAAMYRSDWTSAVAILEAALLINPDDRAIKDVLAIARNARSKEVAAQRTRVTAGKGQ
jgi:tetratricopeptide (TPR) repeat protein